MRYGIRSWVRRIGIGMIAGILGLPAVAWPGAPTEQLRTSINEVIEVLENPEMKKPEKHEERRKLLERIIGRRFSYEEMAKRTLGSEWAKRTPEERKDFVASFQTLLTNTYIGRIENYSGEKIQYLKELSDGEFAEVRTQIDTGKSMIPLDYKMAKKDSEWRVYDVVVEGTGLVQNYREQFRRILRKDSFEALSKMIRDKAAGIPAPGIDAAGAAPRRRTAE
jgi:phospholipid transport system substrate-binding protein